MKTAFETALWYSMNVPKDAHRLNQSVSVNVCMAKMKEIEAQMEYAANSFFDGGSDGKIYS